MQNALFTSPHTTTTNEPNEFVFLSNLIKKYRRDVHQLFEGCSGDSLQLASERLGMELPKDLQAFLLHCNGCILFRGALQIRSVEQLTSAHEIYPQVILFAEGSTQTEGWAFVPNGSDGHIFGLWRDESFIPMHLTFHKWLQASLDILDQGISLPQLKLELRQKIDPNSAYLHLLGQTQQENLNTNTLGEITESIPNWPKAWVLLGDSLAAEHRVSVYLRALDTMTFPVAFPGFLPDSIDFISRIPELSKNRSWVESFKKVILSNITDIRSPLELNVMEKLVLEVGKDFVRHGEREQARMFVADFLQRQSSFSFQGICASAILFLADVQIDVGLHDDAEKTLRPLLIPESEYLYSANIRIGRIAVIRHEPWAENILRDILKYETSPKIRAEAKVLCGEVLLRLGQINESEEMFASAQQQANEFQLYGIEGLALLGLGDVAKNRHRIGSAERYYQTAIEFAERAEDEELRFRILLRQGDLLVAVGEREQAYGNYRLAADCFRMMNLPLREGWARLRMGQIGDSAAGNLGRELFKTMDFAAGVAMADALLHNPSASLSWHLERSQEHARRRIRAQRAIPPLRRQDADRPERRLGSHRMAIASCSDEVVDAIAHEMKSAEKELSVISVLPSHHKFARYLAASDLLAAHRSYKAAEVLLKMVRQDRPAGNIRSALVGALTRSRNMALVDGLLKILEERKAHSGVEMAAEVLGWRREREAVELLCRCLSSDNSVQVRRAAIVALGRIGDSSAVDKLLQCIDEEGLKESTAISLLLLGEWKGLDEQAQALAQQGPNNSQELGEIVGRYGGPSYLLLLLRAVEFKGEQALGAVLGLGYLGDPRVVPKLIEYTASRTPSFSHASSQALETLTGHYESVEESLLRSRWSDWWDKNQGSFQVGRRYRHGEPMTAKTLIDRMVHDDSLVRRTCYDELVISTGLRLPFDIEGPWRVQCAHRDRWLKWWHREGKQMPAGAWLFHGDVIG